MDIYIWLVKILYLKEPKYVEYNPISAPISSITTLLDLIYDYHLQIFVMHLIYLNFFLILIMVSLNLITYIISRFI